MEILDNLNDMIKETRDKYGKSLDPQKIIRVALREAQRQSRKWPDAPQDAPNCYTVNVSEEDWAKYYSQDAAAMSDKLAREIHKRIHTRECTMRGFPRVTIQCDPALGTGAVVVDATFGPRTPIPEDVAEQRGILEGMITRPVTQHAADDDGEGSAYEEDTFSDIDYVIDPTMSFEEARKLGYLSEDAPAGNGSSEQDGGDAEGAVATLSYTEGEFEVRPGMTIGVVRRAAEPAPDIKLPKSEPDDEYKPFLCVSQSHGEFGFEDGSWTFRNDSRNGSDVIYPDAEDEHLEPGDVVFLADGCSISLGEGEPLLFSETEAD